MSVADVASDPDRQSVGVARVPARERMWHSRQVRANGARVWSVRNLCGIIR